MARNAKGAYRPVIAYAPSPARGAIVALAERESLQVDAWHDADAGPLGGRTVLRDALATIPRVLLVDAPATLGTDAERAALEELLGPRGTRVLYAAPPADPVDPVRTAVREAYLLCRRASAKAAKRLGTGGRPRYGWKFVRGRPVEIPYEQTVLGRIVALRATGLGARLIAKRLRELGYVGPGGCRIEGTWVVARLRTLARPAPAPYLARAAKG